MDLGSRIRFLAGHLPTVLTRDDLCIELCTLLNDADRCQEALNLILNRHFHPWEGGEGKVTGQYAFALTRIGLISLEQGDAGTAASMFRRALSYPEKLGEGKLEGKKDNHLYYFLGQAERRLGHNDVALACLRQAAEGDEEPASAMYYNDQPADMIFYEGMAARALGDEAHARSRFHKLIAYGAQTVICRLNVHKIYMNCIKYLRYVREALHQIAHLFNYVHLAFPPVISATPLRIAEPCFCFIVSNHSGVALGFPPFLKFLCCKL
jgi:tetratricopeptide (TPR) repeat protein